MADQTEGEPLRGWQVRMHDYSTRLSGPNPANAWLSWMPAERLAIGTIPTAATVVRLAAEGVTHVVNCRATLETWVSQDLAVERALFGAARVVPAPMWDTGRYQHPRRWSAGAHFAARALEEDPVARVFIHCKQGRRRSVLVAYAVLRLRGHSAATATELILKHRVEAMLVPAYQASVEDWLSAGAPVTT
jgi:protein-tyrosine phosphatase